MTDYEPDRSYRGGFIEFYRRLRASAHSLDPAMASAIEKIARNILQEKGISFLEAMSEQSPRVDIVDLLKHVDPAKIDWDAERAAILKNKDLYLEADRLETESGRRRVTKELLESFGINIEKL